MTYILAVDQSIDSCINRGYVTKEDLTQILEVYPRLLLWLESDLDVDSQKDIMDIVYSKKLQWETIEDAILMFGLGDSLGDIREEGL